MRPWRPSTSRRSAKTRSISPRGNLIPRPSVPGRAITPRTLVLGVAFLTLLLACEGARTVSLYGPDDTLRVRVHVELAETAEARRTGLVGRTELAEGEGLLLVFPVEGEVCITNVDVAFPIDAVFADASGRVVAVERSIAADDPAVRCHAPVATVLELASGAALSVQPYDVLERRP